MKQSATKNKKVLRRQVLESAIASFKIEGIKISREQADNTLKKVELILGK